MKYWNKFKSQCNEAKKKIKVTGGRPHVNKVKITPEELVILKDLNTLGRSVATLRAQAKENSAMYKKSCKEEWASMLEKYELYGKFYADLEAGELYQLGRRPK